MAIDFVYKPLTPIVTFDKPCQCVSFFNRLSEAPPIKDLTKEYYADERPEYPFYINKQKVNLSVDSVEDGGEQSYCYCFNILTLKTYNQYDLA